MINEREKVQVSEMVMNMMVLTRRLATLRRDNGRIVEAMASLAEEMNMQTELLDSCSEQVNHHFDILADLLLRQTSENLCSVEPMGERSSIPEGKGSR